MDEEMKVRERVLDAAEKMRMAAATFDQHFWRQPDTGRNHQLEAFVAAAEALEALANSMNPNSLS